jgi:hypothetical protein
MEAIQTGRLSQGCDTFNTMKVPRFRRIRAFYRVAAKLDNVGLGAHGGAEV